VIKKEKRVIEREKSNKKKRVMKSNKREKSNEKRE
jgi:hypothetical protein